MADVRDLEPYAANVHGLVDVLVDFKSTMPNPVVFKVVGYQALTLWNQTSMLPHINTMWNNLESFTKSLLEAGVTLS